MVGLVLGCCRSELQAAVTQYRTIVQLMATKQTHCSKYPPILLSWGHVCPGTQGPATPADTFYGSSHKHAVKRRNHCSLVTSVVW